MTSIYGFNNVSLSKGRSLGSRMKINLVPRNSFQKAIDKLDPLTDHQLIVRLMSREFSYEAGLTFDIGFLRSLGALRISALLEKTQQMQKHSMKRYEDTFIIISEMTLNGYDSEIGRAALKKMNSIHQRFQIQNEDYLFVLSIYAFELIDWIDKHAWRKISAKEKWAWFYFWVQIGQRMGIQNIPYTEAAFRKFVTEYESRHVQFAPRNKDLAEAYLQVVHQRYHFLKRLSQIMALSGLPELYRISLGLKPLTRIERTMASIGVLVRKVMQNILPFILLSDVSKRYQSYPQGYDVKHIGPTASQTN